jgi:hypothetical protein
MEANQDTTEKSGGSGRSSTPDSLLFINITDQSESSQAANRREARSHIMSRQHRIARRLRVS